LGLLAVLILVSLLVGRRKRWKAGGWLLGMVEGRIGPRLKGMRRLLRRTRKMLLVVGHELLLKVLPLLAGIRLSSHLLDLFLTSKDERLDLTSVDLLFAFDPSFLSSPDHRTSTLVRLLAVDGAGKASRFGRLAERKRLGRSRRGMGETRRLVDGGGGVV
jgi:hypothetical protein